MKNSKLILAVAAVLTAMLCMLKPVDNKLDKSENSINQFSKASLKIR